MLSHLNTTYASFTLRCLKGSSVPLCVRQKGGVLTHLQEDLDAVQRSGSGPGHGSGHSAGHQLPPHQTGPPIPLRELIRDRQLLPDVQHLGPQDRGHHRTGVTTGEGSPQDRGHHMRGVTTGQGSPHERGHHMRGVTCSLQVDMRTHGGLLPPDTHYTLHTHTQTTKDLPTHVGVFPVVDDLLHVVARVEQEVVTPLTPVNGHSAVPIHTERERGRGRGRERFFLIF